MADESRDIVIVGGGAIGLSLAYHLGRRGAADVLLLERDRLTSGSSWHAAGIVGPLRASPNLTRLAQYGIELFERLETETGQATGYQRTGGVWLAQHPERLVELRRIQALGERAGLDTEMLDAAQIADRLPFLYCADLSGGLWVEQDGQINPVDLCMAYAKGAKAQGVEIREASPVVDIETAADGVRAVLLAGGDRIECARLVLCAGVWTRRLGAAAGVDVPLAACEHMFLVTDPVEGLPVPCPIVRDLDAGIYLKGDAGKLLLGAFEANAKAWTPAPDDAGFLIFDEDWEHAQPMLDAGIRRAPIIAGQGVTHFMNGPESFTPDTRQIMGEAAACRNLYVAAGFNSIGIMSSAGVGRVMADWICDGEAPVDLWEVDIARIDPLQNRDAYLAARLPEAVHNQFAMHWPYKQFETGRDLRRSPWHDLLAARGAVFGAPSGWERPLWYAMDAVEAEMRYGYGAQAWWPMAAREARHCSRHVSLFELSPFGKFDVVGRGALDCLQRICSADLDIEADRLRYSLMLNRRGGIESEITVFRLGEDRFRVIGGAATRFKDFQHLTRHAGAEVEIRDVTEEYAVLGMMGPKSRALLQAVCDADSVADHFPPASLGRFEIADCEVLAARISFVGEAGWELYIPSHGARAVLERLLRDGETQELGLAGHYALDGCRLEMGYHHWGHDTGPDIDPYEAGLGFAVADHKDEGFIGSDALVAKRRNGLQRRLRLCEVHAEEALILHDEPVYHGTEVVGHSTSGGPGYRSGKTLCFVLFSTAERLEGCRIEIAGDSWPLEILEQPPCRSRLP